MGDKTGLPSICFEAAGFSVAIRLYHLCALFFRFHDACRGLGRFRTLEACIRMGQSCYLTASFHSWKKPKQRRGRRLGPTHNSLHVPLSVSRSLTLKLVVLEVQEPEVREPSDRLRDRTFLQQGTTGNFGCNGVGRIFQR